MTTFEIILTVGASIITLVGAYIGIVSIIQSRSSIIKKLDRKQEQLRKVNNEIVRTYGLNYSGRGPMTSLDIKKQRLEAEIADLKRKL